jgi:hypothetical protein
MIYPVRCRKCDYANPDYEIWWSELPQDNFPVKCPSCRKKQLVRDWGEPSDCIIRDNTPKTAGQDAERNAKLLGKELTQKKAEEVLGDKTMAKRNAPTPWWREPNSKPLDVSKVKDVKRFIETGEK